MEVKGERERDVPPNPQSSALFSAFSSIASLCSKTLIAVSTSSKSSMSSSDSSSSGSGRGGCSNLSYSTLNAFLIFCLELICLDEEVLIDLISSPETSCLEYVLRITKFLLSHGIILRVSTSPIVTHY